MVKGKKPMRGLGRYVGRKVTLDLDTEMYSGPVGGVVEVAIRGSGHLQTRHYMFATDAGPVLSLTSSGSYNRALIRTNGPKDRIALDNKTIVGKIEGGQRI